MKFWASRINGALYEHDLSPGFLPVDAWTALGPFDYYCLDCLISAVSQVEAPTQ